MLAPPEIARETRAAGFVLIGVLMFILVLTILGLTLFSLSSFESQFFYRSNDEQAARYAAMSGIERAKAVLSGTDSLGLVQNVAGAPIDGLTYSVAKQGPDYATADSIHAMSWTNGKPVWIRSLAVVNGQRSLIEARFTPNGKNDIYGRLFTLSGPGQGLSVPQYSDPPPVSESAQVFLTGALTEGAPTQSFPGIGSPPFPVITGADVTPPDVGAFFGKYWGAATDVPPNCNDNYTLDASAATDQIKFFRTALVSSDDPDAPVGQPAWSLNTDYGGRGTHNCQPYLATIAVSGTCIWMFDHGARFYKRLQVLGSGSPNDALILVAGVNLTTSSDAGQGIVFKQGIANLSNLPIVMVSSGGVGLEHYLALSSSTNISYLSVFAASSDVVGPKLGSQLVLTHESGAPQDLPGGVIERLVERGYLPNTTASTGDFTPIANGWREITSSDGIN